jgi:hypothetical protein
MNNMRHKIIRITNFLSFPCLILYATQFTSNMLALNRDDYLVKSDRGDLLRITAQILPSVLILIIISLFVVRSLINDLDK